ncbi:MAG: PAAR domain-containing protein [Myxococcota bacterium]
MAAVGGRVVTSAAKLGDKVIAVDTHIVLIPSPAGPVPTPLPHPFNGQLVQGLSSTVSIDEKPAAIKGSVALNTAPHIGNGGPFQSPPSNRGTVNQGAASVFIDDKPVARMGDTVETCNDPVDAPQGVVVVEGATVFVT